MIGVGIATVMRATSDSRAMSRMESTRTKYSWMRRRPKNGIRRGMTGGRAKRRVDRRARGVVARPRLQCCGRSRDGGRLRGVVGHAIYRFCRRGVHVTTQNRILSRCQCVGDDVSALVACEGPCSMQGAGLQGRRVCTRPSRPNLGRARPGPTPSIQCLHSAASVLTQLDRDSPNMPQSCKDIRKLLVSAHSRTH